MPRQRYSGWDNWRRSTSHSWIDRSLQCSGRGRRSSIAALELRLADLDWQPSNEDVLCEKKGLRPKGTGAQRASKRQELPAGFVEAQRRHFAEVDAFELESSDESPAREQSEAGWGVSEDEEDEGYSWDAATPPQPGSSHAPLEAHADAATGSGRDEEDLLGCHAPRPHTPSDRMQERTEAAFLADARRHESGVAFAIREEEEDMLEGQPQVDHTPREAEAEGLAAARADDVPTLAALLQECGQEEPVTFTEAIGNFCNITDVVKLGEGTFGEAFGAPGLCFKIVPVGGAVQVNGETQRTVEETFSEVLITNALKGLRNFSAPNACSTFIDTKGVYLCKGAYDSHLINAWEDWDAENGSENEHPMVFPGQQLYVVYVFEDGGKDLERFVIASFEEARSLLHQVVCALAVAEQECSFEHRDLHWGNVLVARSDEAEDVLRFRFEGRDLFARSHGITVSVIDFTLSRLEAGTRLLYYDLSADPWIFEGPARDLQSNTYRRMKKLVQGHWEGRFPKTNCLWLHYLADILLNKKSFVATPLEKKQLGSFRRRVLLYHSAAAAVFDEFFESLWLNGDQGAPSALSVKPLEAQCWPSQGLYTL